MLVMNMNSAADATMTVTIPVTAVDNALSNAALARYGLAPAPKKLSRYAKIDMGKYVEGYDGWIIVFNLDADLGAYELLARADDEESVVTQLAIFREWGAKVIRAWNFTRPVAEDSDEVELLPQPAEGGMAFLPQALLLALGQAYGDAVSPPKDSESK